MVAHLATVFLVSSSIFVRLRARRISASLVQGSDKPRAKQPVVIQTICGRSPRGISRIRKKSVGACAYFSRTHANSVGSVQQTALNCVHSRRHFGASPGGTMTTTGLAEVPFANTTDATTASAT